MTSDGGANDVSPVDDAHLAVIRNSVDKLLRQAGFTLPVGGRILDVAPQDHHGVAPYIGELSTLITIDIDPDSGATVIGDICQRNAQLDDSSFDVIVCTEVLEHVDDPFAAMKEMWRLLKADGHLYASSPFDFRIHGPLPDNWRFTEHGWRLLTRRFREVSITAVENPDRFLMPIHYTVIAIK